MGVPVVATSALKNTGVDKAVKKPVKQLRTVLIVFNIQLTMPNLKRRLPKLLRFSVRLVPERSSRFYAIKLFERDRFG